MEKETLVENEQRERMILERRQLAEQKIHLKWKKQLQKFSVAVGGSICIFAAALTITKFSSKAPKEQIQNTQSSTETIQEFPNTERSKSLDELTYEQLLKMAQKQKPNKPTVKETMDIEEKSHKISANEQSKPLDYNHLLEEQTTEVSSKCDYYDERLTDDLKQIIEEACNRWGVDPNLLIAIGKQESNLKNLPKTAATGMFQIESVNENGKFEAYNFVTNQKEIVDFSKLDLTNVKDNVEAAAIMLQNAMNYFDNPLYSIQGYNYGHVTVKKLLTLQAKNKGVTIDKLTHEDAQEIFYEAHKNPKRYISEKWKYNTYGDWKYSSRICEYCKTRLVYKQTEQNLIVYDLDKGKAIKTYIKSDNNMYIDNETRGLMSKEDIILAINNTTTKTKTY